MLFGYDDGHRLLASSKQLPPQDTSVLLGATDAAITSEVARVITGVPLRDSHCYALCVTWPAPEIPRPGAVWSHALVVDMEAMQTLDQPSRLVVLARHPRGRTDEYREPLVDPDLEPPRPAPEFSELLIEIVLAAYAPDAPRTVVTSALGLAEGLLLALWDAQWPALRMNFGFRTRDQARADTASGEITVARRIRGMRPVETQPRTLPPWVVEVARSLTAINSSAIRGFLSEFGPLDRPEPGTVSALAEIYVAAGRSHSIEVREELEGRFPRPDAATLLKRELFGEDQNRWWDLSEQTRIATLLGARVDAWDPSDLGLVDRVGRLIQLDQLGATLDSVSERLSETMARVVLTALLGVGRPRDFGDVAKRDVPLAAAWLSESPELASDPRTWSDVDAASVEGVLRAMGVVPDHVLAAAINGQHIEAAVRVSGICRALRLAGDAGNFDAVRILLHDRSVNAVADSCHNDSRALMVLAVAANDGMLPRLVEAIDGERGKADEVWLRAAVCALTSRHPPDGAILEVIFGPLHHAITDDRLPRDCWRDLDHVLPTASDPALRLRRLLLKVSRDENWDASRFKLALRDAGPYSDQLLRELDGSDPVAGLIRAILGLVGLRW